MIWNVALAIDSCFITATGGSVMVPPTCDISIVAVTAGADVYVLSNDTVAVVLSADNAKRPLCT